MNWDSLSTKLARSLSRRKALLKEWQHKNTTAFRLFGGAKEGIPGLTIDLYASVAIFNRYQGKCRLDDATLADIGKWYSRELGVSSVYLKEFVSDRSSHQGVFSTEPFLGEAVPSELVILENDLRYLIRPCDGFSTGIFLDQRENRRFLAKLSRGKKMLNCFSYTCGFSVACAVQGAECTSVDLSRKYLEWGKKNFELNKLEMERHHFVVSDVFDFLKHETKRGAKYDLIILDPPSFSRNKDGNAFSIKKDLKNLLCSAFSCLSASGALFFSTNYSRWNTTLLKNAVSGVIASPIRFADLPRTAEDFELEQIPISAIMFSRVGEERRHRGYREQRLSEGLNSLRL